VVAAWYRKGVCGFAVDGGEKCSHYSDLGQHRLLAIAFGIVLRRHRIAAAIAGMEQRVIAEFVPFRRSRPPARDGFRLEARTGEKERTFQARRVERRNDDVELRGQGVVISEDHRRLLALRPRTG
jgi:hypothetical protein